jgi:hypothetical protein
VALTGQGIAGPFVINTLNATSGPSGENPSGQVDFMLSPIQVSGPVTCLAVRGNSATLNVQWLPTHPLSMMTVQVLDDQPDTFDAFPVGRAPTDCSPLPPFLTRPLSGGDITVVDAPPLPTTRGQCTNGGWKRFGFANQGLCVAFVSRHATE